MKSYLLSFFLVFILGCSATLPQSASDISSKIKVEYDRTNGQTTVITDNYAASGGVFMPDFPAIVKYRAIVKGGNLKLIQLYTSVTLTDWRRISSAKGEDGNKLKFIRVERKAINGSVKETFAVVLDVETLNKMSKKDWKINYYGSHGEGYAIIPKILSNAFLNKLNEVM